MKKAIFVILIIISFSCQTQHKDQFRITGTVKDADTGMVYLLKYNTEKWEKADSVVLKDGSFTFTGKSDVPEFYQLRVSGIDGPLSFFVENEEISITIVADSIELSEVSGSATQDLYRSYLDKKMEIDKKMEVIGQQWKAAKDSKDSAAMVSLEKQIDATDVLYKNSIIAFANENPGSVVTPYLIIRNSWQFDLLVLDSLYNKLDSTAKKSLYAQAIDKRINILKSVEIGQQAPGFTMSDTSGNPIVLSSLKGKYLLVDFWASWCGPCRAENPNVVASYNKFKTKGFDILGVSFDRDKGKWLEAIKKDQLTWTHVSDLSYWANAAGKIYGINSIPANVLLDQNQKIIGRNLQGEELNKKLIEIFGEPVVKKNKRQKNI